MRTGANRDCAELLWKRRKDMVGTTHNYACISVYSCRKGGGDHTSTSREPNIYGKDALRRGKRRNTALRITPSHTTNYAWRHFRIGTTALRKSLSHAAKEPFRECGTVLSVCRKTPYRIAKGNISLNKIYHSHTLRSRGRCSVVIFTSFRVFQIFCAIYYQEIDVPKSLFTNWNWIICGNIATKSNDAPQ